MVFGLYPSYKLLCGVFGIYRSFVAGLLNSGGEIHFCVLFNENLKYSDYILKCISDKQCTISFMSFERNYFELSSSGGTVVIQFEIRIMDGKPPSVLILAHDLIRNIRLSSLAYGILSIIA